MTCECCGLTYVDEVAFLAIEDGLMAFREAVIAKHSQDRAAFAEAERLTAEALAVAQGGQG